MSVILKPLSDLCVLQDYLMFLADTPESLKIHHIFSHCNKAIYSKLLHIIWSYGDEFKKVIPVMGGFYQLLCLEKAMYNRYACFGLETWITGTGTTKYVSAAENAAHGFH